VKAGYEKNIKLAMSDSYQRNVLLCQEIIYSSHSISSCGLWQLLSFITKNSNLTVSKQTSLIHLWYATTTKSLPSEKQNNKSI